MNLETTYLGLKLRTPLMVGASPLADKDDLVKRMEDAGVSAIVMHSLFAEQIEGTSAAIARHIHRWDDNFAEATSFFPDVDDFVLGPKEYLDRIAAIKAAVGVPVIASLNGTHLGSWIEHARLVEQAGADALELNTYFLATRRDESAAEVEQRVVDIARAVRDTVRIPVAVKLSPFYTSVAHMVGQLEDVGINGVVMFNRFFQPEIDADALEVTPHLSLSNTEDLRLRIRWLALLRDQTKLSLACTGGVHQAQDLVKALLAGADVVQIVAAVLNRGPEAVRTLLRGLEGWMEEHEYQSVTEMRGALSLRNCPDAEAYERGNYLKTIQLWKS